MNRLKQVAGQVILGEFTVIYKREYGEWTCCALEFNLIGTGKTKSDAFEELTRNLVLYVKEAVYSDDEVEFFHPAEQAEWNRKGKERHRIVIAFEEEIEKDIRDFPEVEDLRPYRDRIRDFSLVPATN